MVIAVVSSVRHGNCYAVEDPMPIVATLAVYNPGPAERLLLKTVPVTGGLSG